MSSRSKGPYIIGSQTFRTQAQAEDFIRAILYQYPLGEALVDFDLVFIQALLSLHPNAEAKIGAGVEAITVSRGNSWRTRHFVVERVDGSSAHFSFLKCLHAASPIQRFKRACRDLVADQVLAFKEAAFAAADSAGQLVCPVLGVPITWADAHVDHAPPLTFDALIEAFITEQELEVATVALVDRGEGFRKGFADAVLECLWREFHRERARLRVMSAEANLRAPKTLAA